MVTAELVSQVCVCGVCKDPLDAELHSAMCLPCGHTLGKQCHTKVSGKCPQCSTGFNPSALPLNHLLHSLLSKITDSSSSTKPACLPPTINSNQTPDKCARCEEKPAQLYCKDCDEVCCKECDGIMHIGKYKSHERLEGSHKPKIVSLDCEEHKGEKVKLFCYDCGKCVCRDCSHAVLGKHSAHSMALLEDAVQKVSGSLREQCGESVSSLKVFAESLETAVGKADACLDEIEKEVSAKWSAAKELRRMSRETRAKAERAEAQCAGDVASVLSLKPRPVEFFVAYEKLRQWLATESKEAESVPNELIPLLETLNRKLPHPNGFSVSVPGFKGLSLTESFSALLSVEQCAKVFEWFGGKREFALLFKASKDGFRAADFHRLCDGKGATLVVVQSESGHLFGGFTSQSWRSAGGYVNCNGDSWVFSLTNPSNTPHKFLPNPQRYQSSIVCNASYGPIFGAGYSLNLSDSCQSNTDSYTDLGHTYCGLGLVYGGTGRTFLCGSYNFKVRDYEVFKVI